MPALLLLVVVNQFILSHFFYLSPWKGGGFGMFSKINQRSLSCQVQMQNGEIKNCLLSFRGHGEYGPFTITRLRSIKNFPTQEKLNQVVEDYMKHQVKLVELNNDQDDKKVLEDFPQVAVKAIKIQLWQLQFNQDKMLISMKALPFVAKSQNWSGPWMA